MFDFVSKMRNNDVAHEEISQMVQKIKNGDEMNLDKHLTDDKLCIIHYASKYGSGRDVRFLLNKVNLEAQDENNLRPIHYACKYGKLSIVKLLLNKVDLEAQDENKKRPIHYACWYGNSKIVQLLLNKVDLEAQDEDKNRPINIACNKNHFKIFKLLFKRVDLEVGNYSKQRPIHYACISGNKKIVKMLISKNVDLEAKNIYDYRPIHIACMYNHTEIVKLLLNRVDLNVACRENIYPIHNALWCNHAFWRNNIDMIKLLVDGFISDKIYATKSLVNLDRLSKDLHLLNMASDKKVSEFIFKKIEAINRTLFIKIEKNYSDVRFI
jgi:ankyrin repeat protein